MTTRRQNIQPIEPDGAPRTYTLGEMRDEMHRLAQILMRLNARYLEREARLNAELWDDPNRATLMDTDKVLRDMSGGAKTVSTILQGLSAVIQGECAWKAEVDRRKRVVFTGGGLRQHPEGGPV